MGSTACENRFLSTAESDKWLTNTFAHFQSFNYYCNAHVANFVNVNKTSSDHIITSRTTLLCKLVQMKDKKRKRKMKKQVKLSVQFKD